MSKSNREIYNKLIEIEMRIDRLLQEKHLQVQLLHQYNDIKDAAQIVINHVANMEGTTVKEIHDRLNLANK